MWIFSRLGRVDYSVWETSQCRCAAMEKRGAMAIMRSANSFFSITDVSRSECEISKAMFVIFHLNTIYLNILFFGQPYRTLPKSAVS